MPVPGPCTCQKPSIYQFPHSLSQNNKYLWSGCCAKVLYPSGVGSLLDAYPVPQIPLSASPPSSIMAEIAHLLFHWLLLHNSSIPVYVLAGIVFYASLLSSAVR